MALVKKSALAGRVSGKSASPPASNSVAQKMDVLPQRLSTRRLQSRTRARHEKAAERIGAATEELAAGIAEAAAASEELGRSLSHIAKSAETASGAAHESQAAVAALSPLFADSKSRAARSLEHTVSLQAMLREVGLQIENLSTATQQNAARQLLSVDLVAALERQAANVVQIADTVSDVADQTSLLALNAAIEAARAGEHGRGFSIVADEVRSFASETEKHAGDAKAVAASISSQVKDAAIRIKSSAEQAGSEARNGQRIKIDLQSILENMAAIGGRADKIFAVAVEAEAATREAGKSAELIASAAEEQSGATAEAGKAVVMQTEALEQSQKTAQALAEVAEALQRDDGADLSAEEVASAAEELSATVQELSSGAVQILASLEQISRGSDLQASAAQQSLTAMTQIEKGASHSRGMCAQSVDQVEELTRLLTSNREATAAIIGAVKQAADQTDLIANVLASLELDARKIGKTVDAISRVAVQINMLAVSGSVEAARAGDFGRGFAVVSADIRKLAQDTLQNAERISDVVWTIGQQVSSVRRDLAQISATSRSEAQRNEAIVDKLLSVDAAVMELRGAFSSILSGTEFAVTTVQEVLAGIQQISAGSEESNAASTQAATAAKQQAKGAEDLAAAIEEIASLADELQIANA